MQALIKPLPESSERSIEIDAHVRRLQELVDRALSLATGLSPDIKTLVSSLDDPLRLAYLLASLLDMKAEDKQKLLEENSVLVKLTAVSMALSREIEVLELEGQDRVARRKGDERRAAAVPAASADEGDPDRARRGRRRREPGACGSASGSAAARADRSGGDARSRAPGADDAGVARVPDDPHLSGLAARRPVGEGRGGSPRSRRSAARPRRGSLRSRQGQRTHRRIPRRAEAAAASNRRVSR